MYIPGEIGTKPMATTCNTKIERLIRRDLNTESFLHVTAVAALAFPDVFVHSDPIHSRLHIKMEGELSNKLYPS
jgi:hypothetical protein